MFLKIESTLCIPRFQAVIDVNLTSFWWSSQVSRHLRLRILSSNVLTILLYISETWKITVTIIKQLYALVDKCWRSIMNIAGRIWYATLNSTRSAYLTSFIIPYIYYLRTNFTARRCSVWFHKKNIKDFFLFCHISLSEM